MADSLRTDGARVIDHASYDDRDAKIEQLLLAGHSPVMIAAARAAAHWALSGLPLVMAAPLFGLLFDLSGAALRMLALTLLLLFWTQALVRLNARQLSTAIGR